MRTLTGRSIVLTVKRNETIFNVKNLIYKIDGIDVKQQRLIYGGKELSEDEMTLMDYNVQKESTLHLMLRLPGG